MQDKNFIIFMVLSIIIIFAWTTFFMEKPEPGPGQPGFDGSTVSGATVAAGATSGIPGTGTGAELKKGDTAAPGLLPPGTDEEGPDEITEAELEEEVVRIQTDVYDIELSSMGAAAKSWKLVQFPMEKCFKYRIDIAWPPITTDPECDERLVDLVDPAFGWPNYQLVTEIRIDGRTNKIYRNTEWEIESGDLVLHGSTETGDVVFSTELPDGREVTKTYSFNSSSYQVDLKVEVEGGALETASTDLALFYQWNPRSKLGVPNWNFNGHITFAEEGSAKGVHKLSPEDVAEDGPLTQEGMDWAGVSTDYFLTAVLTEKGHNLLDFVAKYIGDEKSAEDGKEPKEVVGWVRLRADDKELEEGIALETKLFVGPKNREILMSVRDSLEFSIDYGRLKILVKPLIIALTFINKFIGNFGISIILLTIALRMAMFPLTRTGQKNMKKMQQLQPEIQKAKEKYADDKVKQQEEMQSLWRKHNINPAMGCLPMLLQIPVFIGFYKSLLISVELRHAEFFGWVIDLSSRDPLYIWPVLMGGTQLAMQKMTPTQMDPTQAKIMMAMPIVFTYILRDFPSGLLVYWTVSNLVGVAQQIYVNRQPD